MTDLAFAHSRFGLGLAAREASSGGDPRAWAVSQIGRFQPQLATTLPTRASIAADLAAVYSARADKKAQEVDAAAALKLVQKQAREAYAVLVGARLDSALTTPTPFMERLVHFWANHFAVSATKVTTVGFAGLLEMEAIRPHVTGKFGDMLAAVERHPAMLFYLDQAQSIGPESMAGALAARRGNYRGLNENLAREILELHTLGVRTGYAQADVTEFARALTGWTVAGVSRGPMARFARGGRGEFSFVEAIHQPGSRTIMGKRFAEGGEAQGAAVLAMLATHPATARHIATKLARHFSTDEPPPAMVARLEQAFLSSGGALPTVYRALIASPEAWAVSAPKFRNPWDWGVASLRAMDVTTLSPLAAVQLMKELGQPVWQPPAPTGWDDVAASWAGPDALVRRVEAAQRLADEGGDGVDARVLAPRILGAQLGEKTRTAVARAESPRTGLALMLASPEMLRR